MARSPGEAVFDRELGELRVLGAFLANYSAFASWAISEALRQRTADILDVLIADQFQARVVDPTIESALPEGYDANALAYVDRSALISDITDVLRAVKDYAAAKNLSKRATRNLMRDAISLNARVLERVPEELVTVGGKAAEALKVKGIPFVERGQTYQTRFEAQARTLATGANGWAAREEAKLHGDDLRWITVQDDKVRPAHVHAQGQTVAADEPFYVGGYPMWFPGDPSAPDELTINCRCALAIVEPPNRRWVQRFIPNEWLNASLQASLRALTAAAPNQARAPKGSAGGIGGEWIDTPSAILRSLNRLESGTDIGTDMRPVEVMKAERRRLAAEILEREGRPSLDETAQRVLDIYDMTTPEQRKAGEDWYNISTALAQEMVDNPATDLTMEQAAAAIAHLSTQTRWEANAEYARALASGMDQDQALAFLKEGIASGRVPRARMGGDFLLSRNWEKAQSAMGSSNPVGGLDDLGTFSEKNKTRTFASNILGDQDGVTVDAHMMRVVGQQIMPKGKVKGLNQAYREDQIYESLAEAVRVAAEKRGITPAQMQAITWGWALASHKAGRGGKPGRMVDATTGRELPEQITAALDPLDPDPVTLATEPMPDYHYAMAERLMGQPRVEAEELADPASAVRASLTAAAPNQARAPKGSAGGLGGQWIDTPTGLMDGLEGPDRRAARRWGGKGEPLNFTEASADPALLQDRVNPGAVDGGKEFTQNCTRVAFATEMQARGYPNAVAPPFFNDYPTYQPDMERKWMSPPEGGPYRYFQNVEGGNFAAATANDPPGSRYWVTGSFQKGGAHVWNAEKQADGSFLHIDAQRGQGPVDFTKSPLVSILRVDDLEPTFAAVKGSNDTGEPAWATSRSDLAAEQGVTASALVATAGTSGEAYTDGTDVVLVPPPEQASYNDCLMVVHPDGTITEEYAGDGAFEDWEPLTLTAAAPAQARAPRGTPIGGEWIETPGGILESTRTMRPAGVPDVVREQGGASIDPLTGLQPTDGYQVGLEGYTKIVPEAEFFGPGGEDALYQWIEENQEQLAQPGAHIGLWHDTDTGNVVFDVSMNVKDRDEAIRMGQEGDQVSIWDNVAGDEIQTGGTGEGLRSSADPQADTHRMDDHERSDDTDPRRRAGLRGAPGGLRRLDRGGEARVRPGRDGDPAPADGLSSASSSRSAYAAPNQARAPKGTPIGGQWIPTPGAMLRDLGGPIGALTLPEGVDLDPILVNLGWTMDPVTREVIQPPKADDDDDYYIPDPLNPDVQFGAPIAPPTTYEGLAENLVEVNPGRSIDGGMVNCQRTATAFEMRARGYNVVAPGADGLDGKITNIEKMWQNERGQSQMFTLLPRGTTDEAVGSLVPEERPPGSRFIVVGYNPTTNMGHAWNAEVLDDGSVFQWDPQSGDEMHPSFWGISKINVLRVDDKDPTEAMVYQTGGSPPWVMSEQDYWDTYGKDWAA